MELTSHSEANVNRRIFVCDEVDVPPGTMRECIANGINFLVVRGNDGAILVVPPTCPHMLASLSEGFFDGILLTCAKHLWQWSVCDGRMTGMAEKSLLVYEHEIEDGRIIVRLNEELKYQYS